MDRFEGEGEGGHNIFFRYPVPCHNSTWRRFTPSGFLVDWGLGSPLYPAVAQAAVQAAARGFGGSGGVFARGDRVEWVWHDSACDAQKAYDATEVLLDTYGVDLIVGPACCSSAAAASALAARRGVPVVSWACSAAHLSDKLLHPTFLRVVGASDEFSLAVGSLYKRQGSGEAVVTSILFAEGPLRGLAYTSLAQQMRRVLEGQGGSVGVYAGFDGGESCKAGAGDAKGVRKAVEAVRAGRDSVVIVLGECADYRQVMTFAAMRGLKSERAWLLLSAARDPTCHASAAACGRDDGRDALALSSMSGALSIDWALMPTSRTSVEACMDPAVALGREGLASDFFPPPAGDASPVVPFSGPSGPRGTPPSRAACGAGGSPDGGACSAPWSPCCDTSGHRSDGRGGGAAVGAVEEGGDGDGDGDETNRWGGGGGRVCPGAAGDYRASPDDGVPRGLLTATALMFDAVELGMRVLAAAGRRVGRVGDGGWAGLAAGVGFEGLSGKVEMDDLGNRMGMDVSFRLMEGVTADGASYVSGKEAARYDSASETVQLLRHMQWPASLSGVTACPGALPDGGGLRPPSRAQSTLDKDDHYPCDSTVSSCGGAGCVSVGIGCGNNRNDGANGLLAALDCLSKSPFTCLLLTLALAALLAVALTLAAAAARDKITTRVRRPGLPPPSSPPSVVEPPVSRQKQTAVIGDSPVTALATAGTVAAGVIADTSRLTPTGLSTGETRSVEGEDNRMSPPPPPPPPPPRSESSTRRVAGSGTPGSAASAGSFHPNFAGDPIRTAEAPSSESETPTMADGGGRAALEGQRTGTSRPDEAGGGGDRGGWDVPHHWVGGAAISPAAVRKTASLALQSAPQLQMVQEELEKISFRAREALEEVEVDASLVGVGEIIGSGTFAQVRQGRLFDTMGVVGTGAAKVAVKIPRDARRSTLKHFWFEVLIMKDFNHPNIVRLLRATWRGPRLMMILEYVSRGNLAKVLEETPVLSWPRHKFRMCLDIANGMAYLHRFTHFNELSNSMHDCIIHRDLKPQNLLVTHDYRVKISDFGAATGRGNDPRDTQVGTLLYIAPEIVRGDCYDERCDIYSFAVVLLAMLQLKDDVVTVFAEEAVRRGSTPPAGVGWVGGGLTHMAITNQIVNEGLRPTLPSEVFQTLRILIEQCWAPIPVMRPTFEEIVEFLETIARDEIFERQPSEGEPELNESTGMKSGAVPGQHGCDKDPVVQTGAEVATAAAFGSIPAKREARASVEEMPQGAVAQVHASEQDGHLASVEAAGSVEEQHHPADQVGHTGVSDLSARPWTRRRGKGFIPIKGSTGMEFLKTNNSARLAALVGKKQQQQPQLEEEHGVSIFADEHRTNESRSQADQTGRFGGGSQSLEEGFRGPTSKDLAKAETTRAVDDNQESSSSSSKFVSSRRRLGPETPSPDANSWPSSSPSSSAQKKQPQQPDGSEKSGRDQRAPGSLSRARSPPYAGTPYYTMTSTPSGSGGVYEERNGGIAADAVKPQVLALEGIAEEPPEWGPRHGESAAAVRFEYATQATPTGSSSSNEGRRQQESQEARRNISEEAKEKGDENEKREEQGGLLQQPQPVYNDDDSGSHRRHPGQTSAWGAFSPEQCSSAAELRGTRQRSISGLGPSSSASAGRDEKQRSER
ncbi:Tyrosine kinase specific for activated (GTP-bound) p21cdc42Hs [Ectocarpus siliculosus]|uniref:Tyrosine kinase specific for activated (GTP-bound) p21cdc42Hs n=1 Tax=Ectocarpus siliculosus TaxID=2880 RepID=D8LN78_ECTSI|nr:Tyrosine kinase specific for activated (GTP-bound) p21cdc42Hs [Ectocarpus siliculosus]|eukprot:CBN74841.1 Tyrosine kinase specific for activated (GTP-bound) p21cdc42Hs [Ectocarpus siliculosus]